MFRPQISVVVLALAACASPAPPAPDQIAAASDEARAAADQLFQQLSGELAGALAKGGPASAIGVCKDRAPAIADAIEASAGVDIERTSLRLRSPANAPDAWERATMEDFIARRAAGEEWSAMTAAKVEGDNLRWMRPIPLGAMCATCHGDPAMMTPDLRQALAANYPDDKATGFKVGDLRGAFTARVPIKPVVIP